MDVSPPPIPVDFWPEVPTVASYRLPFQNLLVEIPIESESHVLIALASLIHQQMVSAGEWAAEVGRTSAPIREKSPDEISRSLVESSAGLLAVYEGIYRRGRSIGATDTEPEAVKASTVLGYRAGYVNQQHCRLDLQYYDGVSNRVKTNARGAGKKIYRKLVARLRAMATQEKYHP